MHEKLIALREKIRKGLELTNEEISLLDALQLGLTPEQVAKMTSDAVAATVGQLLEAQRTVAPQEPAAIVPRINGYSSLIRELSLAARGLDFDAAIIRAMSAGSDANGGYLVADEYAKEVLRFIGEYGVLRKYANVIPTSANAIRLSSRSTGMTAYWNAEAAAATQSGITYDQVTLTPSKLSVLSDPISRELLADAFIDMLQEVGIESMDAMAYQEDLAGFSGDGTATYGSFTGVLQHASVNTSPLTGGIAQLDYEFFVALVHAIAAPRRVGASFFAHRTVFEIARKITDADGRPIFIDSTTANIPSTILGYPVVEVEAMPTSSVVGSGDGFIAFGNLRNCVRIYDRQQLVVEVSTQGYVNSVDLFSTDQAVVKHMVREGIIVARPTGLVVGELA